MSQHPRIVPRTHQSTFQPRRWYRWTFPILAGLVGVVVIAVIVTLPYWSWTAIVEQWMGSTLGVIVEIEQFAWDLKRKTVEIQNLTIANPPGYTTPCLGRIESIKLTGNLLPWGERPTGVEHLVIEGVHINLEQRFLFTNLTAVFGRLGSMQPSQSFIIGQFTLKDLTVDVFLNPWGRSPIHQRIQLPDVVESNVHLQAMPNLILSRIVQKAFITMGNPMDNLDVKLDVKGNIDPPNKRNHLVQAD